MTITRTSTRRASRAFAASLAFVLVASACGDDDDDAGSSETTAVIATAASEATAAPDNTDAPDEPVTTAGAADTTAPGDTEAPVTTAEPGPADGEPYNVSVIADQSGPLAVNGIAGIAGINAAVIEINESGGVDGHPIELDTPIDALSTPEGAGAAAIQAVTDEPIAIVGQINTGGLTGLVATMDQARIPLIAATGLDSVVYTPGSWMFTPSLTGTQQAAVYEPLLTEILGSLEGKRIAFVGLAVPSVDSALDNITKTMESAGATLGPVERNATGQIAAFSAQAANIASADPDAVIVVDSIANTTIVSQALTDAGITVPILSGVGSNDDTLLSSLDLPNFYAPRVFNSPVDSATLEQAATNAGATDQMNSPFFAQGYAVGKALAAGLGECAWPCSPAELITALEAVGEIDIGDVAFGPLRFAADRHYGTTTVQFFVWDADAQVAEAIGDPVDV